MPRSRVTKVWYTGVMSVILGVAFVLLALAPQFLRAVWSMREGYAWVHTFPPPADLTGSAVAGESDEKQADARKEEEKMKAFREVGIAAGVVLAELEAAPTSTSATTPARVRAPFPQVDSLYWLIIPSLNINMPIIEGEKNADTALRKGVWLIPGTPMPPEGGNTVVSGHRFLYTSGARTLYHLDKLKPKDEIFVEWKGVRYSYEVYEEKIVPATDISILNNTPQPILTIFTCDPPYSTKNRLYVRARLMQ